MDLEAIREEAAQVCTTAGYPAWSFVPNDVQEFPAAVVNPPQEVAYHRTFSGVGGTVTLAVSVAVDFAEPEDAQRRLDAAMSTGVTGSLVDAFRAHTPTAWETVEFVKSDNTRMVPYGKSGHALATDLVLTFTV